MTNSVFIDPFADADEDTGQSQAKQQEYLHIRIQRMLSSNDILSSQASVVCHAP